MSRRISKGCSCNRARVDPFRSSRECRSSSNEPNRRNLLSLFGASISVYAVSPASLKRPFVIVRLTLGPPVTNMSPEVTFQALRHLARRSTVISVSTPLTRLTRGQHVPFALDGIGHTVRHTKSHGCRGDCLDRRDGPRVRRRGPGREIATISARRGGGFARKRVGRGHLAGVQHRHTHLPL